MPQALPSKSAFRRWLSEFKFSQTPESTFAAQPLKGRLILKDFWYR